MFDVLFGPIWLLLLMSSQALKFIGRKDTYGKDLDASGASDWRFDLDLGMKSPADRSEVSRSVSRESGSAGFSPLLDYLHTLRANRIEWRYYPRAFVFLLKFLALEPFRLLERRWLLRKHIGFEHQDAPVFVLGYYRSGTTYLQDLLLQDSAYGYLNFFQCYFPIGFLVTEKLIKGPLNALLRMLKIPHPAHRTPIHLGMPEEEDVAMVASGFRFAANWGQVFPQRFIEYFRKWVLFEGCTEGERARFEAEMTDLLKRVGIAASGRRLLLKSPPQTARIRMLRRLFPDARFIFIHRNPYLVLKSNLKLWRAFGRLGLQRFDDAYARECIFWCYDAVHERYELEKAELREDQLVEISHDELLRDPLGTVERIYARLELSGFEANRARFESFLERNHGTNLDHYRFEESELVEIERRWGKWITRWGYRRPERL